MARCFRDEDLRADRQPEFTQLDIEASFVDENEVMSTAENMIRTLFSQVLEADLPDPFPQLSCQEAFARYGIDRPDLRIPLELIEVSDLVKDVEFKVFSGPANTERSRVAALLLPDGGQLTRQQIDGYTEFVRQFGAGGLAYIKVNDVDAGRDGLQSPILKFLPDEVIMAILERTGAETGDLVFFGADTAKVVNDSLAALRVRLGHDLNLVEDGWRPLWVVDFPLVEHDGERGCWQAVHHPFTSPRDEDLDLLESDPGAVRARAYDMVLNGTELGGGSIRIHRSQRSTKITPP